MRPYELAFPGVYVDVELSVSRPKRRKVSHTPIDLPEIIEEEKEEETEGEPVPLYDIPMHLETIDLSIEQLVDNWVDIDFSAVF